ncbi:PAS domain S-box protein [Chloroflexota bacterium]
MFESIGAIITGGVIILGFHIRRETTARCRRTEEMLTRIIDGSCVPMFAINSQHNVTHWNVAMESLTGIKREEVIGTDRAWQPFYTEKRMTMADYIVDGASSKEIEAHYPDMSQQSCLIEGAYEATDVFQFLGKERKWLHFTASPIKDDRGKIVGAIETLEDITERNNAEEALRSSEKNYRGLFEGALDAIWVNDLKGKIRAANGAAAKLTGYSVKELCRANVKTFLTEESQKSAEEVRSKLVHHFHQSWLSPSPLPRQPESDTVAQAYQQEIIRKDGTEAICMVTTNLIAGDGNIKGFQNIARDVTEEKRLYENLNYYMQEITRAQEEERKRIARELHDSTAQTLIALLHQLESLLRDKTKLPIREAKSLWLFHEQIREALQEVRHFSRDLRPSILDDLGLLPALEWLVEQLTNEYAVLTSLEVVGREQRLNQEAELLLFRIVQESIRNIAKHAQASKAMVKIEFGEDRVLVNISDDGIGFQLPEKINDLSYIGKLGLAGMMERAKLLGGTVKLKSELDSGTTVFVEAPILLPPKD